MNYWPLDSIEELRQGLSHNYCGCCEAVFFSKEHEYIIMGGEANGRYKFRLGIKTGRADYNYVYEDFNTLDEILDTYQEGKLFRELILEIKLEGIGGIDPELPPGGFHLEISSLDEIYSKITEQQLDLQLSRNGREYFIDHFIRKGADVFTIAANKDNENRLEFNSFDEMLDGYKEDGIPLRDFILEMHIEFEY